MKKVLKRIALAIATVILGLFLVGLMISKPLPEGISGPRAEALADKMLAGLNKKAYDSLKIISWSYPKGHHYIWNKKENTVNVKWEEYEVDFSPDTMEGTAKQSGRSLDGDEQLEAIRQSWAYFANDSFWLVAPYKIRDPGTQRYLVETDRGHALLVTYTSGGVTPGDSYLWFMDENFRPTAWQLWVDIIPVNGLEFSWEGWAQHKGAWFAPYHDGPKNIRLTNLRVE